MKKLLLYSLMTFVYVTAVVSPFVVNKAFAKPKALPLNYTTWVSDNVCIDCGESVQVPTFNAHLGNLDHITIRFGRMYTSYSFKSENLSPGNGCSQNQWVDATGYISENSYGNLTSFSTGDSTTLSLGQYDGITDFAGTSGQTVENLYDLSNVGATDIYDPTFLSLISDDGISTWTANTSQTSNATFTGGCSNVINSATAEFKGTIRIVYWYQ